MLHSNDTLFLHTCMQCRSTFFLKTHRPNFRFCRSCTASLWTRKPRAKLILPGTIYDEKTLTRFWKKVDKDFKCLCHDLENRCWIWTAYIWPANGYGCFSLRDCDEKKDQSITAHRFAYQIAHGELLSDVHVLHRPPCALRHCVRHVYAGDPKQNMQDTKAMGHDRKGENHPNTQLTEAIVLAIRHQYAEGMRLRDLASFYALRLSHVWLLVHRKTWRHLP